MARRNAAQHVSSLTIIGCGPGGVSLSKRAAAQGANMVLIEKPHLDGTYVLVVICRKAPVVCQPVRTSFDDAAAFGWSIEKAQFTMNNWLGAKNAERDHLESRYGNLLREEKV